MNRIETIDLEHHSFLAERFRQMHLNISDYTFANVYLFRDISRYKIITQDCGTFISAYNCHGQNYIMPLSNPGVCSVDTLRQMLDNADFFFPIPEEWLPFFPGQVFGRTYDDSESDYIYRTAGMASFAGKQYTRHRNHLNQFIRSYQVADQPLGGHNLKDAAAILQIWQNESNVSAGKTDFAVCTQALKYFSELALWGIIYYIDRKPAGFIIGEPLNTDTFCLHFAKASKQYHGIYEFMFNDTAKKLEESYTYLNLEEDMGNKNLRKTKASYGPELVLKKYRVCLETAGR